jgi:hypothetical protein
MANHFFCKEEVALYQEIISLLEWKVKQPNNQIFNDFFPVMVSGKALVKLDPSTTRLNYKEFITFKPLKNNKHCQFLVEFLYEDEESDVQDLLTVKQDDRKYGAKIVDNEDNIIEEIYDCDTETEAKFCVIYQHFLGGDIKKLIEPIKKFDEKHKKFMDEKKKNEKKVSKKK